MSLCKFESEIKIIPQPLDLVSARFSDLRSLEILKGQMDKLADGRLSTIPEEQMSQIRGYVQDLTFDADSLQFTSPVGQLTFRIVDRSPECIKFNCEGSPLPLNIWIQLLARDERNTKMRVTVGAEVNMFMKTMVAKPLQQAADGLASLIASSISATVV